MMKSSTELLYQKTHSSEITEDPNTETMFSSYHNEHQAYSQLPENTPENRRLSDEELLSSAATFEDAMGAYNRITGRNSLKQVVGRVVTLNGEKQPKADPTISLTYLERIANHFSETMSPRETRKLNKLIVKQLKKIQHGAAAANPSTVTLDRIAVATDILPDELKETGVRTFEEALHTMEIEIPNDTGEVKIPDATAKAAHQAIEIYQKMPDPTSLKGHLDTITNKTSFEEIHRLEHARGQHYYKTNVGSLDTQPGARISPEELFADD